MVKKLLANVEDVDSIPGLSRSPGGENGNPLQYFCLKNSMDRGAYWAAFHGVAKSWTQLSTHKQIDGKTQVIFFLEYTSLQTILSLPEVYSFLQFRFTLRVWKWSSKAFIIQMCLNSFINYICCLLKFLFF